VKEPDAEAEATPEESLAEDTAISAPEAETEASKS
jgi:hypothetical protein